MDLTYHTSKQLELLPVYPPGPPELLPLTSGPLLCATVVVVGHLTGGSEGRLPSQHQPNCLLLKGGVTTFVVLLSQVQ